MELFEKLKRTILALVGLLFILNSFFITFFDFELIANIMGVNFTEPTALLLVIIAIFYISLTSFGISVLLLIIAIIFKKKFTKALTILELVQNKFNMKVIEYEIFKTMAGFAIGALVFVTIISIGIRVPTPESLFTGFIILIFSIAPNVNKIKVSPITRQKYNL